MSADEKIRVVIIGAGGFGKEVLWALLESNKNSKKYDIMGFLDDDKNKHDKVISGKKVLGSTEWALKNKIKNIKYVIAIGNGKTRKKIVNRLRKKDDEFLTVIHPSTIVSDSAIIGNGTVVQAGTIITVDVKIGNHCRIDTNCTIAHDSRISDFVDLSPGVHINGTNKIQTGAFVGSAAITKENISIGKWSVIGAGTVLLADVPDLSLYVGVPGKLKRKLSMPDENEV